MRQNHCRCDSAARENVATCPVRIEFGLHNFSNIIYMLWTIAIILIVLWLLGMITAFTLGGFIHILLVIAVIIVLIRLFQGKNVV